MKRIRQLRTERGLSQAKLAVMADMDPATLNRLEQGKGNPNLRTLERVADALGVEVADLLGKASAPPALQPSFNGLLEEERRLSRFAESIVTTADAWIRTAAQPGMAERKLLGIADAALELYNAISAPVEDDEEAWERLTNPERREIITVLEKLNEVATYALDRLSQTAEARDQEEKAKQNREKIREWTRKIA
jgi:transcriptional regulator with XRE-family HTH domain